MERLPASRDRAAPAHRRAVLEIDIVRGYAESTFDVIQLSKLLGEIGGRTPSVSRCRPWIQGPIDEED